MIDLEKLRTEAWYGIPMCFPQTRSIVWKLLCSLLPPNQEFWNSTLSDKREDYIECSRTHFSNLTYCEDIEECNLISEEMSSFERENFKQILIDVKRTNPGEVFSSKIAKDMLTRILFVWAFKHPASGYVQGINDLAAIFMYVFIADIVDQLRTDQTNEEVDLTYNAYNISLEQMAMIKEEQIQNIEADSYYCLDNFLETLQENYIDKQPGIYKIIKRVEQILKK